MHSRSRPRRIHLALAALLAAAPALGRDRAERVEQLLGCPAAELADQPLLRSVRWLRQAEVARSATFGELGLELMVAEEKPHRVTTVWIAARGYHGSTHDFEGPLPGGVRLGMRREEARRLLGPPARSHERNERVLLAGVLPSDIPAWDLFVRDGVEIHLEFDSDAPEKGIRMVTLSTPRPAGR